MAASTEVMAQSCEMKADRLLDHKYGCAKEGHKQPSAGKAIKYCDKQQCPQLVVDGIKIYYRPETICRKPNNFKLRKTNPSKPWINRQNPKTMGTL